MNRRTLFAIGVAGLILAEAANVYFIMPMPGSQRMRSVDVAYAIYRWRWWLRIGFGLLIALGAGAVWRQNGRRRWLAPAALTATAAIVYVVNFTMAADHMFLQPRSMTMLPAARNTVPLDRLVVGVALGDDARAYPIRFLGYHHQVRDRVGTQDVLVTYCTVCRTGRVYAPTVNGRPETFRLVGMDHFNAMLEDHTTGSWWRQANGEAITGPSKGSTLPELPYSQVTLREWLALHPASLVMQADSSFESEYAKDYAFERGTSRSALTGTDTSSWGEKSWVIGVMVDGRAKAFDWNRLRRERVINSDVAGTPVVLALAADRASYFVFRRPTAKPFVLRHDSLATNDRAFALSGKGPTGTLQAVAASQEFWHSWRTFQPTTERD